MRPFLKRHMLLAGLLAVMAPLSLLLVLQYRWLNELQSKSALAEQARLRNYLEAIDTEVEFFYKSAAERLLNLPPTLFTGENLARAADYFHKKGTKGARRLFVLSFVKHDRGKLLFYEPWFGTMESPSSVAEARAVYVATAPWHALSEEEAPVDSLDPTVDERDPENRIIMRPILDSDDRVVGVTGMIIDEDHFEQFLAEQIEKSLAKFFPLQTREGIVIHVHDRRGQLVGGSTRSRGEGAEDLSEKNEMTKTFGFVFTDHILGINSLYETPEEYARAGFMLNMSLSVCLALVLLTVIGMALRTASREMHLSQMKNDFVSNVSHELRTPLASIRVFGEFLRLGRVESEEKAREYGEYIETESRRLTALVNNILDFSRIESGRKTYRFKKADLAAVIEQTLKTFDVRLRQSGFLIRREMKDPMPLIRIDSDAITQAVSNLVDNAVKYSGASREIAVDLSREDGWAVIRIVDHGIGISPEDQKKIFERFHRVGSSLVHDVKGSGLGLSIVSHIVAAHRGEVTVESEPGRGSRFAIKLPIDLEITHA